MSFNKEKAILQKPQDHRHLDFYAKDSCQYVFSFVVYMKIKVTLWLRDILHCNIGEKECKAKAALFCILRQKWAP